jgi:site-specific recombinase XerD
MDIQDIIEKAKEKWGNVKTNKITTSALKKTINYIRKTINMSKLFDNEYSYKTLVKICGNSIIRYPAIGAIITLYVKNKDRECILFLDNIQYNIYKIQEIKTIIKSGDLPYINTTSTECVSLIFKLLKEDETYKLTSEEIFQKLYSIYKPQESYVSLKILVAYMSYFLSLKNESLCVSLRELYVRYIEESTDTSSNVFSRESTWKKELIEHLKHINSDRLEKTSAYPELTLKKILSSNVMLMRHLEKYIVKHFNNIPNSIDTLQWFLFTIDIHGLKKAIVFIADNYIVPENDRIKSKHTKHHGYDFVKKTIVFFRDRIPNYLKCKNELNTLNTTEILGKINDQREIPVENIRRHFYAGEVDKIMSNVENDSRYTLIFTILREVGLRVGAIVTLQTKHFINHKGKYLENCRKMEKGKKYRTFPVSENLKEKIKKYLEENVDIKNNLESYLFPSKQSKHISTDSVRNKLIRITESLDIYGHHVHPHAFRHTIVNNLMAKGNKLENVSKYMGHSSISTTEHFYWTTELENIIPTMNIPWLSSSKGIAYPDDIDDDNEIAEESHDLSIDLLVSIVGVYHSVLNEEQKHTIQTRIPNIEQIFSNICQYSMTNTLASRRYQEDEDNIQDFI